MKSKFLVLGATVALALAISWIQMTNCCDSASDCCQVSADCCVQDGAAATAAIPAPAPVPTATASLDGANTETPVSAEACKKACDEKTATCCGLPCPVPCCKN